MKKPESKGGKLSVPTMQTENLPANNRLYHDLKSIVEQSKQEVAIGVNATMSMMYWQIGKRINDDILGNKRAEYGKQVVSTLSDLLTKEYGKGWSDKNLRHMLRFADVFPEKEIVLSLIRQLSWTHMTDEENEPIGLILCATKNEEHIELMQLEKSNIKVAEYLTKLPDMKLLEEKLHISIERAKNRLVQQNSYEKTI